MACGRLESVRCGTPVAWTRRPHESNSILRAPDLGGILGDTICWIAEVIAESKVGSRESGFGGVEVVE